MEHERKPGARAGSMSDGDRALVGAAKRRTPRAGVAITPQAVPVEVPDEVTGNYEGDELRAIRSRRSTDERIGRLEDKHDELRAVVGETREDVSAMRGEMKALPRLVDLIEKMASGAHVALTAQVKVDAAEKLDAIDERKQWRKRWTSIVGGLFSAGVLGALAHYLAGKL